MAVIKLEFCSYTPGSPKNWTDWTSYLVQPPKISKKIEADTTPKGGLIVFDKATILLKYIPGNAVYTAFTSNLSNTTKYLLRISAYKNNKVFRQRFEGLIDLSSVSWGDTEGTVNVSAMDKLSALNVLEQKRIRQFNTISAGQCSYQGSSWLVWEAAESNDTPNIPREAWPLDCGDIWVNPVTKQKHIILSAGLRRAYFARWVYDFALYPATTDTRAFSYGGSFAPTGPDIGRYKSLIYGYDVGIYNTVGTYFGYDEKAIVAYDAVKLILALVRQQFPEISVTYGGFTSFQVPIDYYEKLLSDAPFDTTPVDALKLLANSLFAYIFINRAGNLVIKRKDELSGLGTARELPASLLKIKGDNKLIWGKITDGVTVKARGWKLDDKKEPMQGSAAITKTYSGSTVPIKPRNAMSVDILAGDASMTSTEALNAYAMQVAALYMNFYGSRHEQKDYSLNLSDEMLSDWELCDRFDLNGVQYFAEKITEDLVNDIVDVTLVEATGHDYDPRSIVMSKGSSSELSSGSGSTSASSSSSGGYSVSPYLWDGSDTGLNKKTARESLGQSAHSPLTYDVITGIFSHLDDAATRHVSDAEKNNWIGAYQHSQVSGEDTIHHNHGNISLLKYIDQDLSRTGDVVFHDLIIEGSLILKAPIDFYQTDVLQVTDHTIELGRTAQPSNISADGGGIRLLGGTDGDKSILFDMLNANWTSSENINLAVSRVYRINNNAVLSINALGLTVKNSSLESVGALSGGSIVPGFGNIDIGGNKIFAGDITSSGKVSTRELKSISAAEVPGVKNSSFSLNASLEDVDVVLRFMKQSGDMLLYWNGTLSQLNRPFKPEDFIINRIAQAEPDKPMPGMIWLDPTAN